jgi:hypothetical protein
LPDDRSALAYVIATSASFWFSALALASWAIDVTLEKGSLHQSALWWARRYLLSVAHQGRSVVAMTIADKPATAANARRAQRKTLRALGQIVDEAGNRVECTLLDLSMSGARLKLNSNGPRKAFTRTVEIPALFRLEVARDNIVVECRRAWLDGDLVGAAFTSAFRPLKAAKGAR